MVYVNSPHAGGVHRRRAGDVADNRAGVAEWLTFIGEFRISHYLQTAAQLQKLDPDHRVTRLRELAADPRHGSEIFPLCRMLFQAKDEGRFRSPGIGSIGFVGHTKNTDWPLEPITLREDIPILIAMLFVMGGPRTAHRVSGLLPAHCDWRKIIYPPMDAARVKQIVEGFIAANPQFTKDDASFLRRQCE